MDPSTKTLFVFGAITSILVLLATLPAAIRVATLPSRARRSVLLVYLTYAAAGLLAASVFRKNRGASCVALMVACSASRDAEEPALEAWNADDPGWGSSLRRAIP